MGIFRALVQRPTSRWAVVQITAPGDGTAKRLSPLKYRSWVIVRAVDWDDPAAEALRAAQRVEIAARYGRPDSEPGPAPTAADIAHFVVAVDPDGTPLGCGGLRALDARIGEIKRMYAVPARRGTGVAAAVLRALEDHARARGWAWLRLETGNAQPDAVAFYAKHGYRPIPRFGHYADEPTSLCFEKALA
jgi:GNAT superfamily N-acetyltransferase